MWQLNERRTHKWTNEHTYKQTEWHCHFLSCSSHLKSIATLQPNLGDNWNTTNTVPFSSLFLFLFEHLLYGKTCWYNTWTFPRSLLMGGGICLIIKYGPLVFTLQQRQLLLPWIWSHFLIIQTWALRQGMIWLGLRACKNSWS